MKTCIFQKRILIFSNFSYSRHEKTVHEKSNEIETNAYVVHVVETRVKALRIFSRICFILKPFGQVRKYIIWIKITDCKSTFQCWSSVKLQNLWLKPEKKKRIALKVVYMHSTLIFGINFSLFSQ